MKTRREEPHNAICSSVRLIIVLAIIAGLCYHYGAFESECTPKDPPYHTHHSEK